MNRTVMMQFYIKIFKLLQLYQVTSHFDKDESTPTNDMSTSISNFLTSQSSVMVQMMPTSECQFQCFITMIITANKLTVTNYMRSHATAPVIIHPVAIESCVISAV
jgi:hypothetical protein